MSQLERNMSSLSMEAKYSQYRAIWGRTPDFGMDFWLAAFGPTSIPKASTLVVDSKHHTISFAWSFGDPEDTRQSIFVMAFLISFFHFQTAGITVSLAAECRFFVVCGVNVSITASSTSSWTLAWLFWAWPLLPFRFVSSQGECSRILVGETYENLLASPIEDHNTETLQ